MPTLKERIRALRDCLLDGLIERETPVRLTLLAALAGEHLLLIGPPGTAKSELARRLRWVFRDASYFERHELALTQEGLGRFMAFLTLSFHGGTDVQAPLTLACERLRDEVYRRADLLIVSDGEFPPPGVAAAGCKPKSGDGVNLLAAASVC